MKLMIMLLISLLLATSVEAGKKKCTKCEAKFEKAKKKFEEAERKFNKCKFLKTTNCPTNAQKAPAVCGNPKDVRCDETPGPKELDDLHGVRLQRIHPIARLRAC